MVTGERLDYTERRLAEVGIPVTHIDLSEEVEKPAMRKIRIQGQERTITLNLINEGVKNYEFHNVDSYEAVPVGITERIGEPIRIRLDNQSSLLKDKIKSNFQLYVDRTGLTPEEVPEGADIGYICTNSKELANSESAMGLIPRDLPHEGLVLQLYKMD